MYSWAYAAYPKLYGAEPKMMEAVPFRILNKTRYEPYENLIDH
jgi:hypothetical protein